MIICCFIGGLFCIISIYQLYIKRSYIFINEYFKNLTIITMIAYTICSIGDITHMIIRYKYYLASNDWHPWESYLAGVKDGMYYIGNVTFLTLVFMRIKISFQVSKCAMYYLSLLLFISIICEFMWVFIIIYFAGGSIGNAEFYTALASYPAAVNDFVLNLSLFILFIYKMRHKDSIEGIEIADDIISTESDSDDNGHHNIQQKAVWNVMIKHCILFGIALLINNTWYIVNMINSPTASALIRIYTPRDVENAINIIILWLVLKINNDKYVYLCKCWHSCILKYCMKEDPNVIREGFVIIEPGRMLAVNQAALAAVNYNDRHNDNAELNQNGGHDHNDRHNDNNLAANEADDKVEGHDLIVTDRDNVRENKIEGPNVLLTR